MLQLGWYGDDSDEEDSFGAAVQGNGGSGPLHPSTGLFQEILAGGAARAGPASMIQDRLLGIRMDIERLLQEGAAAGLRDPILDHLEDPSVSEASSGAVDQDINLGICKRRGWIRRTQGEIHESKQSTGTPLSSEHRKPLLKILLKT